MRTYAVIPTYNRETWLGQMIDTLIADGVDVTVVNNGDPLTIPQAAQANVVSYALRPPNLSIIWNVGLDEVERRHNRVARGEEFVVAVLNDDLTLPPRFVHELAGAIEQYEVAAAYPDQHGYGAYVLDRQWPSSPDRRLCGYAFALRGSLGLRADPRIKWWYGDDDLDWQARGRGGVMCVPTVRVTHHEPNVSTNANPELGLQAGQDRETFIRKWGMPPW